MLSSNSWQKKWMDLGSGGGVRFHRLVLRWGRAYIGAVSDSGQPQPTVALCHCCHREHPGHCVGEFSGDWSWSGCGGESFSDSSVSESKLGCGRWNSGSFQILTLQTLCHWTFCLDHCHLSFFSFHQLCTLSVHIPSLPLYM